MPGILGIPAIPTAEELKAAGVALEDHAATQAAAVIEHAKASALEILRQVDLTVDKFIEAAKQLSPEAGDQLHSVLDRVGAASLPIVAQGITVAELQIHVPARKGNFRMSKFLSNLEAVEARILSVIQYIPLVNSTVQQIEANMPGASGQSKFQAALSTALTVAHAGETIPIPTVQLVSGLIETAVNIFNSLGIFKKSGPPATTLAIPALPAPIVTTAAA